MLPPLLQKCANKILGQESAYQALYEIASTQKSLLPFIKSCGMQECLTNAITTSSVSLKARGVSAELLDLLEVVDDRYLANPWARASATSPDARDPITISMAANNPSPGGGPGDIMLDSTLGFAAPGGAANRRGLSPSIRTNFCGKCGQRAGTDDSFCTRCGAKFK